MAEQEEPEETGDVTPQFQPHFEYDDWREAGKPGDKTPYITKGFDIFATKGTYYIVRSDLDTPLFMKISGLHDPKYKGKICDLPEAYQNGDHYFGTSGKKYVIHGDVLHSADDLSTDNTNIKNETLANGPSSGGLHYLVHKGTFYRIGNTKAQGFASLVEGKANKKGAEIEIHEKLRDGICYFALDDYLYVIKTVDIGGGTEALCFYKVTNLADDPGLNYRTVNKSIQMFMPGGYTYNNAAKAVWESIGYIENNSALDVAYNHEYKYSHGSSKSETNKLEQNWELDLTVETEVSSVVMKDSVKTTYKYGGSKTKTTSDEWNESSEETISVSVTVGAGKAWALWQPTVKLGGEKTLISGRDIVATDGVEPDHAPWETED